jgi:4-amino-4-deoxy-L-arabinose transferase-like glycosyltransferase
MQIESEASVTETRASPEPTRIWREPITWLVAILVVAAFFRLFHLRSLFPILVDESIYMRWAEIIDHQGLWFISLLDAKQPLSYWIYAFIRKAAPESDPLLGPRLVSVCAGIASTYLLYRMVRGLSNARAGLLAAFFYAVMPFGVLYDRLAYTDALVNVCAIAITVASVEYFRRGSQGWRGAVLIGVIAGVGFSIKSTFALFLWVPLLAAIFYSGAGYRRSAVRILEIYAVALVLPVIWLLNIPDAPNFEVNNLLFHHTNFFPPADFLTEHPFATLVSNGRLVIQYLFSYITLPLMLAGPAAGVSLAWRRSREAAFFGLVFMAPLLIEVIALWFLHSRYMFPLVWPLAVFTSIALADSRRWVATLVTVTIAVPMIVASSAILIRPENQLHPVDVEEFLSSGPFSGYGIPQAVTYLRKQTSHGAFTLLTDPSFGTPADAFYAYLNLWKGIHVYDAWWLQLPGHGPVLPNAPTEVMRSQYERVSAGVIDFPALERVYYVTDTNYNKPGDVAKREPTARLEARFIKRNGTDSIDVYRLR